MTSSEEAVDSESEVEDSDVTTSSDSASVALVAADSAHDSVSDSVGVAAGFWSLHLQMTGISAPTSSEDSEGLQNRVVVVASECVALSTPRRQ